MGWLLAETSRRGVSLLAISDVGIGITPKWIPKNKLHLQVAAIRKVNPAQSTRDWRREWKK